MSEILCGSKIITSGVYFKIEIARFISFVNGEHTSHIPCATIMSGFNSFKILSFTIYIFFPLLKSSTILSSISLRTFLVHQMMN